MAITADDLKKVVQGTKILVNGGDQLEVLKVYPNAPHHNTIVLWERNGEKEGKKCSQRLLRIFDGEIVDEEFKVMTEFAHENSIILDFAN